MQALKVYPVKDRVKPFFKGLIKGEPLVEVAREGLKREDLTSSLRETYERRIEIATDPDLKKRSKYLDASKVMLVASCPLAWLTGTRLLSLDTSSLTKSTITTLALAAGALITYIGSNSTFMRGINTPVSSFLLIQKFLAPAGLSVSGGIFDFAEKLGGIKSFYDKIPLVILSTCFMVLSLLYLVSSLLSEQLCVPKKQKTSHISKPTGQ